MIEKIKEEFWLWYNHFWIEKHKQELFEQYDGRSVAVSRGKVVAIADDMRKLPNYTGDGTLCYDVPLNLDKLAEKYGFKQGPVK